MRTFSKKSNKLFLAIILTAIFITGLLSTASCSSTLMSYGLSYIKIENPTETSTITINPPGKLFTYSATYYNSAPIRIGFPAKLSIYKDNVVVTEESKNVSLAPYTKETVTFTYQYILLTNTLPNHYSFSVDQI